MKKLIALSLGVSLAALFSVGTWQNEAFAGQTIKVCFTQHVQGSGDPLKGLNVARATSGGGGSGGCNGVDLILVNPGDDFPIAIGDSLEDIGVRCPDCTIYLPPEEGLVISRDMPDGMLRGLVISRQNPDGSLEDITGEVVIGRKLGGPSDASKMGQSEVCKAEDTILDWLLGDCKRPNSAYNLQGGEGSLTSAIGPANEKVWTEWLNRDTPGGSGDYETIKDFVAAGRIDPNPVAIQCRTRDGKPWQAAKQTYTCDANVGGVCRNNQQTNGQRCLDYEVRFRYQ